MLPSCNKLPQGSHIYRVIINTVIMNLLRLQQPPCVRGRRRRHVVINWHFILRAMDGVYVVTQIRLSRLQEGETLLLSS